MHVKDVAGKERAVCDVWQERLLLDEPLFVVDLKNFFGVDVPVVQRTGVGCVQFLEKLFGCYSWFVGNWVFHVVSKERELFFAELAVPVKLDLVQPKNRVVGRLVDRAVGCVGHCVVERVHDVLYLVLRVWIGAKS